MKYLTIGLRPILITIDLFINGNSNTYTIYYIKTKKTRNHGMKLT